MRDDWKDFVKDTSGNYFDTNKLYVKSLLDYKTRNYQHDKNTQQLPPPRLPAISSKGTTKRNSQEGGRRDVRRQDTL